MMSLTMKYIRLKQNQEIPVCTETGVFTIRYAYARANETRKLNESGQDYLSFAYNDETVCFVACDGVSLSYCGDIAAKFLGDALMHWLTSDRLLQTQDSSRFMRKLEEELIRLTDPASRSVSEHVIPEHITGILREVLEEKRSKGSESTFVCGRIDRPSGRFPDGRVMLAWMGDTRLRLWMEDRENSDIFGDSFHTGQRWSTKRGSVGGNPNVHLSSMIGPSKAELSRIAAYTDGLASIDTYPFLPNNDELQRLIDAADMLPESDDIAYIDISMKMK